MFSQASPSPRSPRLTFVLGALIGWLAFQNAALLFFWTGSAWPAVWSVARVMLKIAGMFAVPVLLATLVFGGAAALWAVSRRAKSPPRLEEVRHG